MCLGVVDAEPSFGVEHPVTARTVPPVPVDNPRTARRLSTFEIRKNLTRSGCENRTRVPASTRLEDNHYPNPDTPVLTRWSLE